MKPNWVTISETEDENYLEVYDELYNATYYIFKKHEIILRRCDGKTDLNQIIKEYSDEEEAKMILNKLFVCDLVRKQKNVFFKFRYTTYFTVWSAKKNNKLCGTFAKYNFVYGI